MKHLRYLNPFFCLIWNLSLSMVLLMLSRVVFLLENSGIFPGLSFDTAVRLCLAGLKFDINTCVYVCSVTILMNLLPVRLRGNRIYSGISKAFFITGNALALAINLADTVYFKYTNRRTTWDFFTEFDGGENLGTIFFSEVLSHWYLVLVFAVFVFVLIKCYARPFVNQPVERPLPVIMQSILMAACIYLIMVALRGSFNFASHPITPDHAGRYVETPIQAGIVLNTPFSLYRSISRESFRNPHWFEDDRDEMFRLYPGPIRTPSPEAEFTAKNVVYIILESFSEAYSQRLTALRGKKEEGYMPFVDSLMQESLSWRWSFANGRKSIEAMPSLFCGIPSMVESFVLTPYFTDEVGGIAAELGGKKGYATAFFHGAPSGSMGFEAFANVAGFDEMHNLESFGDRSKFDGTWAIFDEPFLQYTVAEMSKLHEPFLSAIFTATSHHPFKIEPGYEDVFKGGTLPMYRAVQYSDNALRRFFEAARREPWFDNTIFVISGDHASMTDRAEYNTSYGSYQIPIMIYLPDGSLKGMREGIAQQCDMFPTVMGILGYDEPFLSFGVDLLSTPEDEQWAVNYINGVFQYYKGDWCLQFDGEKPVGLYHFKTDRLQLDNLLEDNKQTAGQLTLEIKALAQQYIERIMTDNLVIRDVE